MDLGKPLRLSHWEVEHVFLFLSSSQTRFALIACEAEHMGMYEGVIGLVSFSCSAKAVQLRSPDPIQILRQVLRPSPILADRRVLSGET